MITIELFTEMFPRGGWPPNGTLRSAAAREELLGYLNTYMPRYEINTYLRVCGFFGCTAVETAGYMTTIEVGPDSYFRRLYELDRRKARMLGNTQPGDGARFRGRGLMQTTGRDNYQTFTNATRSELDIDFTRHPERLAEIGIAAQSACFYWQWANLSQYADESQWRRLNARVNTGNANGSPVHWAERLAHTNRWLNRLPRDFTFEQPRVGADARVAAGASGRIGGVAEGLGKAGNRR